MKNVKYKVSRPVIREFIEIYKRLPCLWKVQCQDYNNRPVRREGYKLLAKTLAKIEPGANLKTVVQRINSLRTNYRKERRKVLDAELNGGQFEPRLWYYDMLQFLEDQDDSEIDIIALNPVKAQYNSTLNSTDDDDNDDDDDTSSPLPPTDTKFEMALMTGSPSESVGMASCLDEVKPRKRKCDDVLNTANHNQFQIDGRFVKCEDRHDAFGRSIAFKLRALQDEQRIYVEKIINEAIFEAELGNLSRHCRIQL